MTDGVIVIVDLGHDNCQMIKEDVESFGIKAEIINHIVEKAELDALGEITGFILNGGTCKNVRGFRPECSEIIYEMELPIFSVDHAGSTGVDRYKWAEDEAVRREDIAYFLRERCKLEV